MNIRVVRSSQDLDCLRPVWDELGKTNTTSPPWTTYEWFSSWYYASSKAISPYIILFLENGKPIGLAPLVRTVVRAYGMSFVQLGFISDTNPNEMIIGQSDQPRCVAALFSHLYEAEHEWDVLKLRGLRKQSTTSQVLEVFLQKSGRRWIWDNSIQSPYLPIQTDWENYYRNLSKNLRNSVRRGVKEIQRCGILKTLDYSTPDSVDAGIEIIYKISERSWQAQEGTDISSGKDGRFYATFAKAAAHRGWLNLKILFLDDHPIAFEYNICLGGTVYELKSGYDLTYRQFSPGKILMRYNVEYFISQKFSEIDFMGAADEYKLQWTKLVCPYSNLWMYAQKKKSTVHYFIRAKIISKIRHYKVLKKLQRKLGRLGSSSDKQL
ncbi:MAG TPA: GNAT family N-acetyltransferase [Cyclobacteriaceae bacterium]|nr:GNAT family N-acetyltransferase [Cyclobacteriaceae bacterium]